MSFSDTIFLFFLALILFGPKKLPEMAKQAGRLLAELRRASNEFRSQIETEIAHLEVQKEVQKDAEKSKTSAVSTPPANMASQAVNPAVSESIPHKPAAPATLAAPTGDAASATLSSVPTSSSSESLSQASDPASQTSHV